MSEWKLANDDVTDQLTRHNRGKSESEKRCELHGVGEGTNRRNLGVFDPLGMIHRQKVHDYPKVGRGKTTISDSHLELTVKRSWFARSSILKGKIVLPEYGWVPPSTPRKYPRPSCERLKENSDADVRRTHMLGRYNS